VREAEWVQLDDSEKENYLTKKFKQEGINLSKLKEKPIPVPSFEGIREGGSCRLIVELQRICFRYAELASEQDNGAQDIDQREAFGFVRLEAICETSQRR